MKRVLILAYSAFAIIMLANYFYYKNLYSKQIQYIIQLLDRQVQIVGLEVDSTNNNFVSDITKINYSQNLAGFFDRNRPDIKRRTVEELQLFFSKYRAFVTKIRVYDDNFNEFTLIQDEDEAWIPNEFEALDQRTVETMEVLRKTEDGFDYYSTILKDGRPAGNIIVSVDYRKYFQKLFSKFNLKDYQWQWVLSDEGDIIYSNFGDSIRYTQVDRIVEDLSNGSISNLTHAGFENGKRFEIISSYYSTQLLQRDFGIVFSAHTAYFQKYIIRNSIFIVIGTLLIIQLIIIIFWLHIRAESSEKKRLQDSEKVLTRLIEEMPVGVIIHNRSGEIIKANQIAAGFYSFSGDEEMKGKIFPESADAALSSDFLKYYGGPLNHGQYITVKKEIGEIVLYRSSIPASFQGEDAILEILIDVTGLESARKQEAQANVAKSEFLARMSYEIRTPLNGIIGMTDVLSRFDLVQEVRDIVTLLRRSTEVLLDIINDILDFSKIESGNMIIDEAPFNIREEIFCAIDLAKANIGEKHVSIGCTIDDNVPVTIIGDAFRLRQVLVNLLNHSLLNTPKGEIRLRCRTGSVREGIVALQFEMLDTGKSFDKASLKKIFGDFVDAESMSFRTGDESVFTTILARRLVGLMGGTLSASSPSGLNGPLGTKVTFSINAYLNQREIKGLDLTGIRTLQQIRTIVITGTHSRDEEFLASLHKIGLTASVTTFHKATINQIKSNLSGQSDRYNLVIIMDDREFDGFEVLNALWESKLTSNLIIIMVSSSDRRGNLLKCINTGADHYIVKPFDSAEFLALIKKSFPSLDGDGEREGIRNLRKDLQILVVEDNKMNQIIIVKMLKSMGYECDLAEEGYEGYTKARNRKYDIIFMDLVLPEMDGFESARRILEFDRSNLIVAFTADNMPDSRKKAELSGIKEYISKPVRIEDLKKLFAKYFS